MDQPQVELAQVTGVGEIIFLDAHLPAGNHVGNDVLLRRVLVNSVRIFGDGNYFASFLIHGPISRLQSNSNHLQSRLTDGGTCYLIDESATLEAGYLTPADVWTFEVSVQEQVEGEGDIFARIVDADVEMQFFLAQDQPVGQAKSAHPKLKNDENLSVHSMKTKRILRIVPR